MQKIFLLFFLFIIQFGNAQKVISSKVEKLIIGTWIKKSEQKRGESENLNIDCKETIIYYKEGKYSLKNCHGQETGNWKISADNKNIVWFNRSNGIGDGEMFIPIILINNSKLTTSVLFEIEDSIWDEMFESYIRSK